MSEKGDFALEEFKFDGVTEYAAMFISMMRNVEPDPFSCFICGKMFQSGERVCYSVDLVAKKAMSFQLAHVECK